ncbi:MAG: GAF domain-containing protein [Deltaproteobacteria bacterium]|nr:GAF domain-containing protein [Deltaproteobacteria bacterium]
MLSTFAPVRSVGWVVVLEEPVDVALAELRMVERYAFLLLGVGIVLGALVIVWVSNRITEPILELHRGAEVIGRGNLHHRVEIKTGDEIGQLAQEFNKMAGELQTSYSTLEQKVEQRTSELAALYDVTATVNQSLELDTILQEVIKKISGIFHFDATRIFLFNPQGDELQLRASIETQPEFFTGVRVFHRGQGVVGRVAQTGRPIIFEDALTDPRYQAISQTKVTQKAGISFFAVFPINAKGKCAGTIAFLGQKPRKLTGEEERLLTSMANQIGIALENAALFEQVRTRSQQLAALNTITATVNRSLEPDVVLKESVEKVRELLGFDAAWIYVLDPTAQELHLRAYKGLGEEVVRSMYRREIGTGNMGRVIASGEPLVYEDIQTDPDYLQGSATRRAQSLGFRTLCNFPVKSKARILGVLNLANSSRRRLSSGDLELIASIANEIGVGVENASLVYDTKQKSLELEQANVELVEANRAKADFLAAMSHELRTPLNVIIGNADLIKDGMFGDLTEKQKIALEKILHYSETLLKLINDVLTMTRMEAQKTSLKVSTFDVGEIIAHAQSYVEQLNRDGHLKVLWQVEPGLPPMTTDALKLEEILQNLIGNAFKFTPKGRIEVRVQDLRGNGRIEFSVADTGIGIANHELDRIFEQFHQLGEAHTGSYSGVGLGLSIVKRYLEMMQGKIRVESQPGKGSTFTFELPCSIQ